MIPRPPVIIFIFARLRGNLNSEATSKSLFILPYYGKFKAKPLQKIKIMIHFLKTNIVHEAIGKVIYSKYYKHSNRYCIFAVFWTDWAFRAILKISSIF